MIHVLFFLLFVFFVVLLPPAYLFVEDHSDEIVPAIVWALFVGGMYWIIRSILDVLKLS